MKRTLILFSMAAALLLGLTSCEENKISEYIICTDDGSTNYTVNVLLQYKVNSVISTSDKKSFQRNSFKGTESDAITWFNERMDYLESEQFANTEPIVPVLPNTSATFSLRDSDNNGQNSESIVNDNGWQHTVTSRTVTFSEPDHLL